MYARSVEERELTFQVSGYLWQRSLVMRDLETETLWSHLLGRGMRGTLEGVMLPTIPASMTTWADWRARHPETTVLAMSRTARRFDEGSWKTPGRFVYGVALGPDLPSPAVSLARLQENGVVPVKAGDEPLVFTHTERGGSVQAFSATVDSRELRFTRTSDTEMTDEETGSRWDMLSGEALDGPMKGRRLPIRSGTISYRKAWEAFYPGEQVVD